MQARQGKVLSTRPAMDHGHRPASCDTKYIAGSKRRGVDCGQGRRYVYDNPQHHAKDNRTAHLTARSDKSVAYVTKNKKLYSTLGAFCTVKAITTDKHEASRGPFATAELLVHSRLKT